MQKGGKSLSLGNTSLKEGRRGCFGKRKGKAHRRLWLSRGEVFNQETTLLGWREITLIGQMCEDTLRTLMRLGPRLGRSLVRQSAV